MLLWHSARQKSATVDELSHLAAGLYALETGDFRLNRTSPPLQNIVCALPVFLFADYELTFDNQCWEYGLWNGLGSNLVKANPENFHDLLMLGRTGSISLSILLCLLIYRWSREWWGEWAALLVLFLAIFEPNLMAHGRLITTDTAAILCFLLAGYCLDRFLQSPRWLWLSLMGVSFGLTWYAKHSGVLILPAFILAISLYIWRVPEHLRWFGSEWMMKLTRITRSLIYILLILLCVTGIGMFILWGGYGFEVGDTIEPPIEAGRFLLWQKLWVNCQTIANLFGHEGEVSDEPFVAQTLWGAIRSWLPAFSHWEAFLANQNHLVSGHRGYFLGMISLHGWRSYYPILFLVKTPLPLLILMVIGCIVLAARKIQVESIRLFSICTIPLVYLIVLIFWNTANIGYRHALPALPYLFIFLVGPAFAYLIEQLQGIKNSPQDKRKESYLLSLLMALLLLWNAGEAIVIHPHYLAYFNSMVGGARSGHTIAVDSNLDWGQDLFFLRDYLQKNDISDPYLIYFGPQDLLDAYGIPHRNVKHEDGLQPGIYVISATALHGIGNPLPGSMMEPFLQREPDVYITPTMFLYRFSGSE